MTLPDESKPGPAAPASPARAARRDAARAAGARALAALFAFAPAPALAADSLAVHVEVGTATEISNEQFYESSIDDTTFLGRRLHDTPETRVAAVALAELLRTTGDGRWQMRFAPEASVGDEASRVAAAASVRGRPTERLRIALEPRAEFRRDDGFGLRRRDWRASVTGRVRLLSPDELSALRFSAGSEVVRALEGSDPFVLSGTSARAALGFSRTPLFGPEWDVEYGAIGRVFRDSTARDHLEHRLAAALRQDFGGGHSLALSADVDRRVALRDVASSRDRFTRVQSALSGSLALGERWDLRPELGAEAVRYDDPDSLVDFDYRILGAQVSVQCELGPAWRAGTGPRAEWLTAPWNAAEEYVELAWALELERLTANGWWSLTPLAGHRRYAESAPAAPAADLLAPLLHSSFDFVELNAFLDQQLPAALRVRALAALRAERHDDPDHDARSLYFSFDVRRLF